jgi:hypothetical protein
MPDNKQNNNAGFNPATINKVINNAGLKTREQNEERL